MTGAALGALLGLFGASFLAATVLPVSSELALAAVLRADVAPVALVLGVATLGNTLGSVVNGLIGRGLRHLSDPEAAPGATHARALRWFARYGRPTLLLAWAPVVGDAVTVVAGAARVPWGSFVLLVALGKAARYGAVAWLVA